MEMEIFNVFIFKEVGYQADRRLLGKSPIGASP